MKKAFIYRKFLNGYHHCGAPESRRYLSIQRKEGWESVIGLEVHAQIKSDSKLFSAASVCYGAPVNTQVSLFDCAMPGTLPVLNKHCVEAGVLTSLALNCNVNKVSEFDRKHYFYADLPAGFQITQQRKPIASDGFLEFVVWTPGIHKLPYYRRSNIKQVQLEQDSGKTLHDDSSQRSLIDLNRAGIPLMEIVFNPDLKDGEEAGALVKELMLILQSLGTCDCKLEEGSLRVDANISVNRVGEDMGVRTEIKNLGSVRALVNSIEFEVARQIKLLESGGTVVNETRSYDSVHKETLPMRDKEVKQDYRFMPEPNLPKLVLSSDPESGKTSNSNLINITHLKTRLKDLPDTIRKRIMQDFNLRLEMALTIVSTHGFLDYFLAVMKFQPAEAGVRVANVLQNQVLRVLNEMGMSFEQCTVTPNVFCMLFDVLNASQVNLDKVEDILRLILTGDKRLPKEIAEAEGWIQINDEEAIFKLCSKVLQDNPKLAKSFKDTKNTKHLNKLMGLFRKETGGKYDMKKVSESFLSIIADPDKQPRPI